jgi:predicted phage gp36 major capsid-like protein
VTSPGQRARSPATRSPPSSALSFTHSPADKENLMDQMKKVGREVETETKKQIRDLDGHDLGDDLGNAGDEVKKDLGNLGDDLHRGAHEVGNEVDRRWDETEKKIR